ncbi:MAG: hypothetical protein PWP21_1526 [Thermosediminibacterales bacterium]|nr:hypothetical protein [Thermosediminibacterales bacterium]
MNRLHKKGYINSMHYYRPDKKPGEKTKVKRVAAICYLTHKGVKALGKDIDPRYVEPQRDKLEVYNLIGKLYEKFPDLISRREAVEKMGIKNFMPLTCIIPSTPPIIISILGRSKSYEDESRIASFAKTRPIEGTYVIISHSFNARYLESDSYFIHWDRALEVMPNIAKERNYYMNEFISILKRQYRDISIYPATSDLFVKARISGRPFFLGELVSGSNRLRFELRNPPDNTYIYIKNRSDLIGVDLEHGKFYYYLSSENKAYKMENRDGEIKTELLWG